MKARVWLTVVSLLVLSLGRFVGIDEAVADGGVSALTRVDPVEPGPQWSAAAAGGAALTEELLDEGDSHQRAIGALALGFRPTASILVTGHVRGHYDRHTGDSPDDGWVGDPRLAVTVARHGQQASFGLRLGLWLPGADAPSIELDAASFDASAVWTRHGPTSLTAQAGFRIDRSTAAVDAARLSPADRVGLGYSDADAALFGFGVRRAAGAWTLVGELSAELLVGADAPSLGASPWRLGLGAHRALSSTIGLEAMVEVSGSARPAFDEMPPERLVAIEPRAGVGLGLVWRPAPPRRAVVTPIEPPPPVEPPPVEPPPPTTAAVAGHVTDDTGSPVPDAMVTIGDATTTTGDDGRYTLPDLPLGDATLTIERGGYQPATQPVTVAVGGAAVDVVLARVKLPSQIRGLVRDFGGKGLTAGIKIMPLGLELTTQADGTFTVDVPPGTYKVTVTLSGFRTQEKTVVVEDQGVSSLNIDLQKVRR